MIQTTLKYCIIGYPLEFSLSPIIHHYWYQKYNINSFYTKNRISPNILEEFIYSIKENKDYNGFNITMPFKEKIKQYCKNLSIEASESEAVNTVKIINSELFGYNTDCFAFNHLLNEYSQTYNKVLILGAGGYSKSVINVLLKNPSNVIHVINRNIEKAVLLKKFYNNKLEIIENFSAESYDLIINATPINNINYLKLVEDVRASNKNTLFIDAAYTNNLTPLEKACKDLGRNIINGKTLLIYQAAKAFEIWFDFFPAIDQALFSKINLEINKTH
ncbi:MAG: shikimate dehydrogenase [Sphingobacteriia bacterium]|nr:shikimate dehydrogenase [Sphingobacteriia bacterium]